MISSQNWLLWLRALVVRNSALLNPGISDEEYFPNYPATGSEWPNLVETQLENWAKMEVIRLPTPGSQFGPKVQTCTPTEELPLQVVRSHRDLSS